jgi:hypothetical protein
METYKLYTWSTKLLHGPSFHISFVATTVEEARKGLLAELYEIKKTFIWHVHRPGMDIMDPSRTELISDDFVDIADFTEDTKLESGELLAQYITRIEPCTSSFKRARILVGY